MTRQTTPSAEHAAEWYNSRRRNERIAWGLTTLCTCFAFLPVLLGMDLMKGGYALVRSMGFAAPARPVIEALLAANPAALSEPMHPV